MPYLIDTIRNKFSVLSQNVITYALDSWQWIYHITHPNHTLYNKFQTNHTILLIHGFLGWGREEFLGIKYWGGINNDIQNELVGYGYPSVTVGVGPISSNWDRAIETYYQLKGGVVDYGACHAAAAGHQRFGFNYTTALLSKWDVDHPVDIISHSLGGTTARMLIKLLIDGSPEERACADNINGNYGEIFAGHKNWVTSATTISSPHKGATITNCIEQNIDLPAELFSLLTVFAGKGKTTENVYNFRLNHWTDLELTPKTKEDFNDFLVRAIKGFLLNNTITDSAMHDLTYQGMQKFTAATKLNDADNDKIHYFSYSTRSSHPSVYMPYDDKEVANMDVMLPFIPASNCIGTYNDLNYNNSWHPNDSVVNTISQDGPIDAKIIHHNNRSFTSKKPIKPGVWHHCGEFAGFDHIDIIGFNRVLNPLDNHIVGNFYYRLAGSLFGIGHPENEYCPQADI